MAGTPAEHGGRAAACCRIADLEVALRGGDRGHPAPRGCRADRSGAGVAAGLARPGRGRWGLHPAGPTPLPMVSPSVSPLALGPGLTDGAGACAGLQRAADHGRPLPSQAPGRNSPSWSAAPLVATQSARPRPPTRNLTDAQPTPSPPRAESPASPSHPRGPAPTRAWSPYVLSPTTPPTCGRWARGARVGATVPRDAGTLSRLPALLETLSRRGLGEADLPPWPTNPPARAGRHVGELSVSRSTWAAGPGYAQHPQQADPRR